MLRPNRIAVHRPFWHGDAVKFGLIPTPPELFRQFERGEISREELHACMAVHARDLITQMAEARKNPIAAYLEQMRNRAMAHRLTRKHGRALVRSVLATLGRIEGFPPAQILWNANHGDVPLHCFFRARVEPVFRVIKMDVSAMHIRLHIEYGAHARNRTTRESILLQRDACHQWEVAERRPDGNP